MPHRLRSLLALTAGVVAAMALIAIWHARGPDERDGQRLEWQLQTQDAVQRHQAELRLLPRSETWALYLESYSGEALVLINGVPLRSGRIASPTPAVGGAQPLLLPLPAELLRTGLNRIEIQLRGALPGSGHVGTTWLGPEQRLAPRHAQRQFLKHTALVGLIVSAFVLACVSLTLWLRRRQERIYAWDAVACFTGAAYSALPISTLPLPPQAVDAAMMLLYLWFVVSAAWLGLCLSGRHPPLTQRILHGASFGGSALIVLAALVLGGAGFRAALPWIYASIILLGTYTTLTVFWRQYLTRWDATSTWMLGAVMCICMASLHDGALLLGLIGPDDGFWLAYAAPPPMIVFTAILLRHFVQALAESESLNRELEQRVAAREARIAEDYRALQRADRERAVSAERERLFGDLHDGLGGTLMATLSRLSNEGAADSAAARGVQSALDDLRLALTSLHPEERSLRAALAPLRERLHAASEDAGLELRFELHGLADSLELPHTQTLQLLRVLQEAGMNAVRHARARKLLVRLSISGGLLEAQVDDDGIGLPENAERPGHYGLANLRRRAAQLGGHIEWQPLQPGTRVLLRFALDAAA